MNKHPLIHNIKNTVVHNKYINFEPLGAGSFGIVFSALDNTNNTKVIIKFIKTDSYNNVLYDLINEITCIRTLNPKCHQNNKFELCYLDSFYVNILSKDEQDEQSYFTIVTRELSSSISIFDFITKNTEPISQYNAYTIIYTLINQLYTMHKYDIIHKDIKPENTLIQINSDGNIITDVTFIDFGLSCLENKCSPGGTRTYMAPEMYGAMYLTNDQLNYKKPITEDEYKKTDIFSLGVLFYVMLNKSYPHNIDITNKEEFKKYFLNNTPLKKNRYVAETISLNELFNFILERMLDFNPHTRINITELKNILESFDRILDKYMIEVHKIIPNYYPFITPSMRKRNIISTVSNSSLTPLQKEQINNIVIKEELLQPTTEPENLQELQLKLQQKELKLQQKELELQQIKQELLQEIDNMIIKEESTNQHGNLQQKELQLQQKELQLQQIEQELQQRAQKLQQQKQNKIINLTNIKDELENLINFEQNKMSE